MTKVVEATYAEYVETQALADHLMATAPGATREKAEMFAAAVAWLQLPKERKFTRGIPHHRFVDDASMAEINWTTPEGLTLGGVSAQNEWLALFALNLTGSGLIPTEKDIAAAKESVDRNRSIDNMGTTIALRSAMNRAKQIAAADKAGLRQLAIAEAGHIQSAISNQAANLRPREGVSSFKRAAGDRLVSLADWFATAALRKTHEPPEDRIQAILGEFEQVRDVMIARGWTVQGAEPAASPTTAEAVPA